MEHCAIDLGGRKSQICIRDARGAIVYEGRWDTASLPDYVRQLPPCRVILETCAEAFRIADAARETGHEVRVVPATLVRALGVGARRTKTDRRDAQALSEASSRIDLPSVHIPSLQSREWKSMGRMHDALIASRTKLINTLRGWLRGRGNKVARGSTETFAERMRQLGPLPEYVQCQVEALSALSKEIKASERRLEQTAKAHEVCRRLMGVPGIGPATSLRFLAAVDDVSRFESATKLAGYLGLAPGENSSSERELRTGITKAGPADVRWLLVQAAWSLRYRSRGAETVRLRAWANEIEKRRGKQIATVALARKLACILYALWRDGTNFELRG